MTITAARLIRWTGLTTLLAGLTFAGIQPFHPPDVLASVTTSAWAIITPIKTVMAMLFLLGMTGLYARHLHRVGWLGLIGYLLLSVFWALQTALIFAETVLIPPLASAAPAFVEGFLGLVNGHPTSVDLGALPAIWALTGIVYVLGGLLFGIATFRAGILPRWAPGLLAAASVLTPLAALLPHAVQRLAAVPVGVALAGMGYALWSERRDDSPETASDTATRSLRTT